MANSFSMFERHLEDLRRICPAVDEVFVCPICFKVIHRDDVTKETVDLGHVWPEFIRNNLGSDVAKHQQVLLCKSCNSRAGSCGDNEMQNHEKARKGLHPSKVELIPLDGSERFEVRAHVIIEDETEKGVNCRFRFQRMTRDAFIHNKQMNSLRNMGEGGIEFAAMVDVYNTNWRLAQAGWLTSGYLMAFYTLGYRYILHRSLNPVRAYILQSFDGSVDDRLVLNDEKDIGVRICQVDPIESPQIRFIPKIPGSTKIDHLEVNFLDYQTRLPFILRPSATFNVDGSLADNVYIFGEVTDHMPHDGMCFWEAIMDDPTYSVVGSSMIERASDAPNEKSESEAE